MSAVKTLAAPIPPGGMIGILGGGQLGRMLALAAASLGFKSHVFSDKTDAPAFQVATAKTAAEYTDWTALKTFIEQCDAITFEFENIPAETVEFAAKLAATNPAASALRITQDRIKEKTFVRSLGIGTPAFQTVTSERAAATAFDSLGCAHAVLKTARMGYDGKGQALVGSASEAAHGFALLKQPAILEAYVDFQYEMSVVAARGMNGAFAAYDPPENIHGGGILHRSLVPGRVTEQIAREVKSLTQKIADAFGYVGVLAVEFFVSRDGKLLVNEIAPRVHNSGHWTIEACAVSQFEQHVRAIAGWPLGDPGRHANAVMQNIIGPDANDWAIYAGRGGGLHLYGKSEAKPGRKMGHITTLTPKTH
jgi:5-(carboxyamino)imidazole ribonucleotide synthase